MTASLNHQAHRVNHMRVQRLMRFMGLEAIYPKPKLSVRDEQHKVLPYLLRGLNIGRPNQVWASEITDIRLCRGFVYLVVVMDWFSRYVLSWSVSLTMDVHFCLVALQKALSQGTPEIFNTDQGSHFTSREFTIAESVMRHLNFGKMWGSCSEVPSFGCTNRFQFNRHWLIDH